MPYYEKVLRIYSKEIENIGSKDTVSFEKPAILGCFSLDKDRNYVPNASNMMYYYSRDEEMKNDRLSLDLNQGIQNAVPKPNMYEKLDNLLKFIDKHRDTLTIAAEESSKQKTLQVDFVCYRGLLTQIMCTLHLKEEWTVYATKYNGTIYLCAADAEKNYNIPKREMDKFCSWGYKFEQYMLTSKKGVPPDTSKPVYEAEEFCCVFKSKLGSHKILYGAEMDGILSNTVIDVDNPDWGKIEFIELKTSKKVFHVNQDKNLKMYKFIKWWAQSFLVNVQQVHCGFRDKYGLVQEIVPFAVKDLPRQSSNLWNWRTCLNFCNIFLNIVKETIPAETNCKNTVWEFAWNPRNEHFTYKEYKDKSTYTFLSNWYNL